MRPVTAIAAGTVAGLAIFSIAFAAAGGSGFFNLF